MSFFQAAISDLAEKAATAKNGDWVGHLLYFFAVITVSSLGSVAKMLGDEEGKITKRVVLTYLVTGITAGLVMALLLIEKHGGSFLLVGICGVAGFGSVQILSVLSLGLQSIVKQITGQK